MSDRVSRLAGATVPQSKLNLVSQINMFWMGPHTPDHQCCCRDGLCVCVSVCLWGGGETTFVWKNAKSMHRHPRRRKHLLRLNPPISGQNGSGKDDHCSHTSRQTDTYPMSNTICSTMCLLKVMITKSFCGKQEREIQREISTLKIQYTLSLLY